LHRSSHVQPPQRLRFDDDLSVNNQVRAISADDNAPEHHLERHFSLHPQAGVLKHYSQRVRVDGFREADAELRVNIVHPADDGARQFMMQQLRLVPFHAVSVPFREIRVQMPLAQCS